MTPLAHGAARPERVLAEALPYSMDPVALFAACRGLGGAAWLDSGEGTGGRYHILTAEPREFLLARGSRIVWRDEAGRVHRYRGDPFRLVAERLAARPVVPGPFPFPGGAVGYFGYELGYPVVHLPPVRSRGEAPDLAVGMYDWAIVWDHQERQAWLLLLPGAAMCRSRLRALTALARAPTHHRLGSVAADTDLHAYRRRFDRVMRYINDGDCYQVNLSRGYRAALQGDPLSAYLALRSRSPAPHGAFLQHGDRAVLSISPERFLSLRHGRVETRPIKGTRPRETDPDADRARARELAESRKDQAENVMIVDLLRNDLGRVCEVGSIAVPELFRVESHPTVHHLVSTVTGTLSAGVSAAMLLRACFPGGSITGAPKRRAMQIIAELEPDRRGVYCGAIGYLGYDGGMDTSIAIRTAVLHRGELRYRAGGGLVSDSRPGAEFEETEHKARAFLGMADRAS